jgi:hypothetical protein
MAFLAQKQANVLAWQRKKGLVDDGVVGSKTWNTLCNTFIPMSVACSREWLGLVMESDCSRSWKLS